MNKTYLCVLPLTLVLAAYSGHSVADDPVCEKDPDTMPKCEGDPKAPMVTLNLNTMKVTPPCVRAYKGTTIVFRLTPKKGLENITVEILPKEKVNFWLQGKNDEFDDVIIVRVPGVHKPKEKYEFTDHDYSIKAPGKCLDPRIQVEH